MSVDWNSPAIIAKAKQGAIEGVRQAIFIVDAEAVRLITNTPKTGRIYVRRGIAHQASAPGEAPASDTGRLVNSRTVENAVGEAKSRVVFRTEYAMPLEVGTPKMEARPFGRPALMNTKDEVISTIAASIRNALS